RLLQLRTSSSALSLGTLRCLDEGPAECLLYVREAQSSQEGSERMLIAINFSARRQRVAVSSLQGRGELVLSTDLDRTAGAVPLDHIELGPDEGLVIRLG